MFSFGPFETNGNNNGILPGRHLYDLEQQIVVVGLYKLAIFHSP